MAPASKYGRVILTEFDQSLSAQMEISWSVAARIKRFRCGTSRVPMEVPMLFFEGIAVVCEQWLSVQTET